MGDPSSIVLDFPICFVAGGVAGAVSKTITAPIERVKLAIQSQDANPKVTSGETKRYTGLGDGFARHYRELGLASFWRGHAANCIRYVPATAFNLAFKDSFKAFFPVYNKKKQFVKFAAVNFSSGALAGAAANLVMYPLLYAHTILVADLGKVQRYNGMGDCLVKTAKTSGVLSLYRGFLPSTLGVLIYRSTQFGLQDTLKAYNRRQKDFTLLGIISKLCVAQFSVSVSGLAAYPCDTVLHRLHLEASKSPDRKLYKGFADCVLKMQSQEGAGSFWKGAFGNILRGFGATFVLVFYDEIKNAID